MAPLMWPACKLERIREDLACVVVLSLPNLRPGASPGHVMPRQIDPHIGIMVKAPKPI